MTRRFLVALVVCALPVAALIAQQQLPPTFRGSAVLVTVDAYPQQNGRIVEGLKPEDFEVLEDGKVQQVENFQFVRVQPALSDDERRDPNSGDDGNRLAADPKNRAFVVFLDYAHVTVTGSHDTRRPLVDTLRRMLSPTDLFGVMTSKMRPSDLVFGRSLQAIDDQLTKYWPWGERGRMMPAFDDPDEQGLYDHYHLNRCNAERFYDDGVTRRLLAEVLVLRRREDRTLAALEGLVARLGDLREARTAILLFSDGWRLFAPDRKLAEEAWDKSVCGPGDTPPPPPIPGVGVLRSPNTRLAIGDKSLNDDASWSQELMRLAALENERRFRDLIAAAQRRNVSFYPIDPEGLEVFDASINSRETLSRRADPSLTNLGLDQTRLRNRIQDLRTLAENTDGLAVVDTNDLAGGLRKIVNDMSAYYLLGYYATNTKLDGAYHRIQVRMKRPGVDVKARRGYFAPKENANAARSMATTASSTTAPAATAAPVTDALAALTRTRPSTELVIYGAPRANELTIVAEIPSAQIESGRWLQGGDVQAVVTGPNGEALGSVNGRIEAAARGVALIVPLGGGSTGPWRVDVKLSAGSERLEDRATIEAPKPSGLLGEPIAYRAAPGPRSPIRPVADFQFRRTERVHVEWPLLKPIDQRQARLLAKNGQPLPVATTLTESARGRREDSESSSAGASASGGGAPLASNNEAGAVTMVAVDVNLAPLGPGDYVIEVSAGAGAQAEKRYLAIRVVQLP